MLDELIYFGYKKESYALMIYWYNDFDESDTENYIVENTGNRQSYSQLIHPCILC